MSDFFNDNNEDLLKEFDLLKDNFSKSMVIDDVKVEDLSKTMVIPRVEDLIEERPLQPAADADSLFKAVPADQRIRGRQALKAEKEAAEKAAKAEQSEKKARIRKEKKSEKPKQEVTEEPKHEIKEDVQADPIREESEIKKPKKSKKKKKFRIHWKRLILAIIALGLLCCIGVGIWVWSIVKDVPQINPDNIYELLSENSIIYDRNGTVIDNIYQGDSLRTNLEYSEMPEQLIESFVSIEDKTFWKHNGFNFVRIVGAVWQKVSGQADKIGGTSTITQQLARNLYLSEIKSQRTMSRKITEAYYTIQLEKSLTKEQIIEAYLNTIYLGYNCNGVAAAAQAYFSKDVKDLELLECAQLAALPQSPNAYAPLKRIAIADVTDMESLDIITKDDTYVTYYNDAASDRVNLVLYYMHDQGKIDDATYETAKADSIRGYLNPGASAINTYTTSYFADYVKSEVRKDLIASGYDEETADKMLYSGGLRINSTMDMTIQEIMDTEYDNPENFPGVVIQNKDKQGNVITDTSDIGLLDANGNRPESKIILYNMENYFNADGDFVLGKDEFEWMTDGNLKVYKGFRLNIYKTSVQDTIDYSVEFKSMYEVDENKVLYSRTGGVWNIDPSYKDRDDSGNLILSKTYFEDYPDAFTKNEDGTITLSKDYFTLKQAIRQPQSAMVIMDYKTGQILGMVGGREISGKLLYNRALSTRQPGSSIKPLAVYSVALQKGKDGAVGYTAAKPVDDAPIVYNYQMWPKNWYTGYHGITNLRHAVEQSINACSVNLFMEMNDAMASVAQLQKMGITSLVTEGDITDVNASALALGGMANGISPLEMTAAYGTFGNYGVYTEPICYTTVTTKNGDVILSKEASQTKVLDEDVASLMTDILRTTVTNGLGSKAKLSSQPSAGKTGTTSERYDIWFCGLTPQYSAACWIGSDVNIPVNSDSGYAAKLWAKIMDQVGALVPREEFVMKGDFVTESVDKYTGGPVTENTDSSSIITEKFIKGTEPSVAGYNTEIGYQTVTICAESGLKATPLCTNTYTITGIVRPGGVSWAAQLASYQHTLEQGIEAGDPKALAVQRLNKVYDMSTVDDAVNDAPGVYCPYHNPDPEQYPTLDIGDYGLGEYGDMGYGLDVMEEDPEDLLDVEVTDTPTETDTRAEIVEEESLDD